MWRRMCYNLFRKKQRKRRPLKMKKLIALLLAFIMLLSFAACSENGGKAEAEVIKITPE